MIYNKNYQQGSNYGRILAIQIGEEKLMRLNIHCGKTTSLIYVH